LKLGKSADACALFSEAYGREAVKKLSVFEWHKCSKTFVRT